MSVEHIGRQSQGWSTTPAFVVYLTYLTYLT
jgi:hypothetical protein